MRRTLKHKRLGDFTGASPGRVQPGQCHRRKGFSRRFTSIITWQRPPFEDWATVALAEPMTERDVAVWNQFEMENATLDICSGMRHARFYWRRGAVVRWFLK